MLSKVAEKVYWAARYLERIENTARLIGIYDKLLFDLPNDTSLSWYNLVEINSLQKMFNERYTVKDERNVVKFLLGDDTNASSMMTSLNLLRENIRTSRDVVPEDTWELTNELSLYIKDNIQVGISRKNRYEFLDNVIKGCQQIQGLLYGSMSHDAAWHFLRLGRNLERADMTTRILDAGIAGIVETWGDDNAINSHQLVLGNVLRSLNAMQSYRRTVRTPVHSREVVEFLLNDMLFPRSITHCLKAMEDSASRIPKSKKIVSLIESLCQEDYIADKPEKLGVALRDYLNERQIDLGNIHELIRKTWFSVT